MSFPLWTWGATAGLIGLTLALAALHTNELPFVNAGRPAAWASDIPIGLAPAAIFGTLAVATAARLLKTVGDAARGSVATAALMS